MTVGTQPAADAGALLARIQALYDRGKLVAAHHLGKALGPLACWPGTQGRVLAGRLAGQLSAGRLSDALLLRAWRADQQSLLAAYFRTFVLLQRHGTFVALEAIRAFELAPDADREQHADWVGLSAYVYALLRDFEVAERHHAQAAELAPERPFRWVERSTLYELEDRYAEALQAAERAMDADPGSRRAVQQSARLLTLHERNPEAIALLRAKLLDIESPPLAFQLAQLEHEAGDYTAALASLTRGEKLAPIPDKGLADWLAQRRCDAWLRLGDLERALEQARASRNPHYQAFVERVESDRHENRRVQLPVGFVRQHHMTCAPATLTAISRYWSKPADHLEVAEDICYDGTAHHSERRWAVEHAFVAREFRVTWEVTRALIERGVPFTLTTVYPSYAHLQAVIGFDALQGTLVIRDPTEPTHAEFVEKPFFEWSHANGPRGMLLVPAEEAHRVEGVVLPEAELYDLLHAVQDALVDHRRDDAVALCERLASLAAEHRIALEARRSLANYDANDTETLAMVEALLRLFPEDIPLRLHKAGLLSVLRPHAEHLAYLQQQLESKVSDAMFALRLAQGLIGDAREHPRALKLLRRVLRSQPHCAEAWSTAADFHWQRGAYAWATQMYRIASSLQPTHEGAALAYFRAARKVREEERALAYLRARVVGLGRLSRAPWQSLHFALEELDRTAESLRELEAALAAYPDDAGLMLFAARQFARTGDFQHAWPLLDRARQGTRRSDWLRSAATIHQYAGDLPQALALTREVCALAPLDLGAQREVARLLDAVEGRAAALAHLREAAHRFDHHWGVNQLLVEWLSDEPLAQQEQAVRHLLAIGPDAAWAQRELASVLAQQRRFDEAQQALEQARVLAPAAPAFHTTCAFIALLRGDRAAVRTACRDALAISVDNDYALQRLLESCTTLDERREELAFVYQQLKGQVTRGDGMYTFQQVARGTYEPEELLAILREALAARPDLWHAWVAVGRQHVAMNRLDEALELCDEAARRFPLLPRVHAERAELMRLRGERAAEQESLREALRLSPGWAQACCRLADSLEAQGDLAGSRAVLESAVRHAPGEGYLHGYLADVLWRQEERPLSLEHLTRALRLDPGYEWAWLALRTRGEECGEPERAIALAHEITASRAADTRAWLGLAAVTADEQERLHASERAVQLTPLSVRAHSRRAQALVDAGRFDEALAALSATAWGEALPTELRAQRARIQAARGDVKTAVTTMHGVLNADPQYVEGWAALADWQLELRDFAGYLAAAEQLHRLAPNDPHALGYLAHANRTHGTNVDARPWLRRALQLKPDYAWAAGELFDLELEAGNLDAARAALDTLKTHSPSPTTLAREVELHARRRDKHAAMRRYRELLRVTGEERDAIRIAASALVAAGWRYDLLETLDIAVRDPATHPAAGTAWVNFSLEIIGSGFMPAREALENGALGRAAGEAYLEDLAKTRSKPRLRRFLRRMRGWLAADTATWGLVGYALLEAGFTDRASRWLADWRGRPGVQPWILLNAACALRDQGEDADAAAVSRRALELSPDHARVCHELWLAADAALAGWREEATQRLARAKAEESDAYYQCLMLLVETVLLLDDPARGSPADRYREALTLVRRGVALQRDLGRYPALRRMLGQTLWRAALTRAGRRALAAPLFLWLWFTT